jgi:hypothetical protein
MSAAAIGGAGGGGDRSHAQNETRPTDGASNAPHAHAATGTSCPAATEEAAEKEDEEEELIFSTHEQRLLAFPQLRDVIYLDNAGAALPCNSQLAAATADLLASPYANPHSVGPAAALTASAVRDVRSEILRTLFNVTPAEYVPTDSISPVSPPTPPPPPPVTAAAVISALIDVPFSW